MIPDYADINRSLKRKVTKAKRDGLARVVVDVSFLNNVSVALDSLVQARKMAKKDSLICVAGSVEPPKEG